MHNTSFERFIFFFPKYTVLIKCSAGLLTILEDLIFEILRIFKIFEVFKILKLYASPGCKANSLMARYPLSYLREGTHSNNQILITYESLKGI